MYSAIRWSGSTSWRPQWMNFALSRIFSAKAESETVRNQPSGGASCMSPPLPHFGQLYVIVARPPMLVVTFHPGDGTGGFGSYALGTSSARPALTSAAPTELSRWNFSPLLRILICICQSPLDNVLVQECKKPSRCY